MASFGVLWHWIGLKVSSFLWESWGNDAGDTGVGVRAAILGFSEANLRFEEVVGLDNTMYSPVQAPWTELLSCSIVFGGYAIL
ncbi:hypothetical protein F3Y22_tig00110223pilonHSYRG00327 [Hibiscus syriacus]|uniref:Uncharacterized protein n=1 Tax=Hibiscus syriacus TaxID=106335 RepID=A0A6A3B7R3_HIBSY|nr:hypothetical protein F3Y22_tig00110223pilonHSYRG00327 [Hibiscus syriacus]